MGVIKADISSVDYSSNECHHPKNKSTNPQKVPAQIYTDADMCTYMLHLSTLGMLNVYSKVCDARR